MWPPSVECRNSPLFDLVLRFYMKMFLPACMCAACMQSCGSRKRASCPLKLEFYLRSVLQVLGTKPQCSGRATRVKHVSETPRRTWCSLPVSLKAPDKHSRALPSPSSQRTPAISAPPASPTRASPTSFQVHPWLHSEASQQNPST